MRPFPPLAPPEKEQRFREVLTLELQMLDKARDDTLREPGAIYGHVSTT